MNIKGSARTKPGEALLIIDRFLHGYTTEEICKETGKSRENVLSYIAYYKFRKSGTPCRGSLSISKDGADAICEKYGFKKDYSTIIKGTPKQAEQKPAEEPQEEQSEPEEKPVTVGCFTGEAKWVLHYLAQVKAALNDLCNKQDRTNELLTDLIDIWRK